MLAPTLLRIISPSSEARKECVLELIHVGADVNITDEDNAVALQYAAFNGEDMDMIDLHVLYTVQELV